MPEAPKKDEAPNIGVKPVAPKAVALNVKDPATGTKTTTPKAVINSVPRIIYGVAKKAEKESGYMEQGNSFLNEPIEIPFHCGTPKDTWSCHLQIESKPSSLVNSF